MSKPTQITKDMTIGEALRLVAEQRRHRIALVAGDERVTYGQLVERVAALSGWLRELGVGKGDRVAVLLRPDAAFVYLFFAVAEAGAVIAPLPFRMRVGQLETVVRQLEPILVVTSSGLEVPGGLEALDALRRELPALRHILLTDVPSGAGPSWDSMLSGPPPARRAPEPGSPDDLLVILYTSGTTGQAKGVMHSHRGLISPVVASIKLREMWMTFLPTFRRMKRWVRALFRYGLRLLRAAGRQQVFLSVMEIHTISGVEAMLQGLLMGDRLVLMPRFHPARALELVQREGVTILVGPPVAYTAMLQVRDFERYRLSSLLICATGSAPCPPDLARQIQRRFRCALHIGFGMTELGGGVAATSLEDSPARQAETVGRLMPGMEAKVVDDDGQPLPPGSVGELAIRSDSLMLGYFGAPAGTPAVTDEERWLYTGDLAVIDQAGYIQIVGRKKDVIIRGGKKVIPHRVEQHIEAMAGIREAAVVGVPDPLGVEDVWAFVIPDDGAAFTEQEVLAHCRAALEAHEIPRHVRVVAEFPRTPTGKLQKHELRRLALKELETHDGEA